MAVVCFVMKICICIAEIVTGARSDITHEQLRLSKPQCARIYCVLRGIRPLAMKLFVYMTPFFFESRLQSMARSPLHFSPSEMPPVKAEVPNLAAVAATG